MPSRRLVPLLVVLLVVLAAAGCAADDTADDAADDAGSPSASPSSPAPSASATATGVPPEAAAGYEAALSVMGPAFTRFGRQYGRAVAAKDTAGVMASARRLRAAVVDFDSAVRALDLSAEQHLVDTLLMLDGEFVTTLDDVVGAATGTEAVRIAEGLPFKDFSVAFTALRDAL